MTGLSLAFVRVRHVPFFSITDRENSGTAITARGAVEAVLYPVMASENVVVPNFAIFPLNEPAKIDGIDGALFERITDAT